MYWNLVWNCKRVWTRVESVVSAQIKRPLQQLNVLLLFAQEQWHYCYSRVYVPLNGRFNLFIHQGNAHTLLLHEYVKGKGWELWRPVCERNDVVKTLEELDNYLKESTSDRTNVPGTREIEARSLRLAGDR